MRRMIFVLALAVLAGSMVPAYAQTPNTRVFNGGAGVILYTIKSDKTADFETAWAGIRAGFAKATDKPELKAFGDTLTKMFKVDLGAQGASQPQQVYILQVDAPSKAHSYNPVKIVYETLLGAGVLTREEADGIYNKLKDSVANINVWPLVKIGS